MYHPETQYRYKETGLKKEAKKYKKRRKKYLKKKKLTTSSANLALSSSSSGMGVVGVMAWMESPPPAPSAMQ